MSQSAINTQGMILERALEATSTMMAPDAARFLLALRLDPVDEQRADELAAKAREGALSEEEGDEIDAYRRVGRLIEILRIRARLALSSVG